MVNRQSQIIATTHLTTKLTTHNYLVCRKKIQSTLISLQLEDFITDISNQPPRQTKDKDGKPIPNPKYLPWYRKDQMIFSAIQGSYYDSIQSHISLQPQLVKHGKDFKKASPPPIDLASSPWSPNSPKNPKGNRSIIEFLHEIRPIVDAQTLAQCPVIEEYLMGHILPQLGDDYIPIVVEIKVIDNPLSYFELFD